MKKLSSVLIVAAALSITACSENESNKEKSTTMENPFFNEYQTPFGVPPFQLIKNEHFKEAFEEGMKQQKMEIDNLINNSDGPTFQNTIEAYEYSGKLLQNVSTVFYNLNSANTSDEIQRIARELSPLLSAHSDDIKLNERLFERIREVYNNQQNSELNTEQRMLLDKVYKSFARSGALLDENQKNRLREINAQISKNTLQFGQNILAETNNYQLVVENEGDLAGLPQGIIEAASNDALAKGLEGKWVFTLQNPSVMPFLQYADNRDLRQKIWNAFALKGDNNNDLDNKKIVAELVSLRAEKAKILGYESHAHYVLEESMAKTPENVFGLLNEVWKPALKSAKQELKEIETYAKNSGADFKIEPWDWRYYEEKIRKEKYDFDQEELKPYLSLENVRNGIFYTVGKLYQLNFEKLEDVPTYHEDVSAYKVVQEGNLIGILYMDFHPRASKRGGAWMTSYRKQQITDGERIAPVISIVCNFSKPTENTPALLTFDEATTFFHEFGHALHGLLSNVKYHSLSGTSVPRDFVELPSQVLENWAAEPEVLKVYAKHYQTGETIPQELLDKMEKSGKFGQGFATVEYLAASLLDMEYHTQTEALQVDVNTFEKNTTTKIGLIDEIIPRYRSTYFNHIFAGGYSSGYYSYLWSEVLDKDAFQAFKETSLFDEKTAQLFRTYVLETGGTVDPAELYRKFRGAEPQVAPMMFSRGLMSKKELN